MDTWRISVLKNSALDYIVKCMSPLRWDFTLPAVIVLLPENAETAPCAST